MTAPQPLRPDPAKPASGTVKWAVDNFLRDCRAKDLSDETIDGYRYKLRPFLAHLVDRGVQRIHALRQEHVQGFMVDLRDSGKSPNNLVAYGRVLKVFLGWLADNEMVDATIVRRFKLPKAAITLRNGFTRAELSTLVEAAAHTGLALRDEALLLTLIDTGIRAGEVGRIRDADVDFDSILINGKGRKQRRVPISPKTRKAIQRWQRRRGESEYLFITRSDEPMARHTVYKLFHRLGEATGISPCYPHRVRRSTAIEWIRAGGDTFSLQGLLGHSSQHMTKVYVDLASEDISQKHRKLSLVQNLRKGRDTL